MFTDMQVPTLRVSFMVLVETAHSAFPPRVLLAAAHPPHPSQHRLSQSPVLEFLMLELAPVSLLGGRMVGEESQPGPGQTQLLSLIIYRRWKRRTDQRSPKGCSQGQIKQWARAMNVGPGLFNPDCSESQALLQCLGQITKSPGTSEPSF